MRCDDADEKDRQLNHALVTMSAMPDSEFRVFKFRRHMDRHPRLMYVGGAFLVLLGAVAFSKSEWVWGSGHLFVGGYMLLSTRWSLQTPLIELTSWDLVMNRGYLSKPLRIPLRKVRYVDVSQPARITLRLYDQTEFVIPMDWLEWSDRTRFLTCLNSAIEQH